MELVMPGRISNDQMDASTSRAVAHGIGERLRQSLATEARFPERLQRLLDEMADREARDGDKSKNS